MVARGNLGILINSTDLFSRESRKGAWLRSGDYFVPLLYIIETRCCRPFIYVGVMRGKPHVTVWSTDVVERRVLLKRSILSGYVCVPNEEIAGLKYSLWVAWAFYIGVVVRESLLFCLWTSWSGGYYSKDRSSHAMCVDEEIARVKCSLWIVWAFIYCKENICCSWSMNAVFVGFNVLLKRSIWACRVHWMKK